MEPYAQKDLEHQRAIDEDDAREAWIESRQQELMQDIELDDVDDFLCMQADVPTQSRILLEILKMRRDGKELPQKIKENVDALYAHLECVMWDKAESELKGR